MIPLIIVKPLYDGEQFEDFYLVLTWQSGNETASCH